MIRIAAVSSVLFVASWSAYAASPASDLAPTGTLRATYIATNPVQAFVDPATGETRGPAAALAAGLANRAGVPMIISGAPSVQGVIDSVRNGVADIGFVAFDPARAEQVDFSQAYVLAQNTYIVAEQSPIRSVADSDHPGVHIGVTARDAGDTFLTRTLKSATLTRSEGGINDALVKSLLAGEIQAIAGNRMRLQTIAKNTPGLRVVPDNFYGVEQAIIVPKGSAARLAIVEKFIDAARASGLIAESIARAGLVGADVAPKAAVDLSGVWSPVGGGGGGGDASARYPESEWSAGKLPFTPLGRAAFEANKPGKGPRQVPIPQRNDPLSQANPPGLYRTLVYSRPSEFVQSAGKIIQVFEWGRVWRAIYTDGRPVPKDVAAGPYWYGYSVGRWEGDTLVVNTLALDSRAWFDEWGTPFSDNARIEERWQRVSPDRIELKITVTDPEIYSRPWTSSPVIYRKQRPGVEPQEIIMAPIDEAAFNADIAGPAGSSPRK